MKCGITYKELFTNNFFKLKSKQVKSKYNITICNLKDNVYSIEVRGKAKSFLTLIYIKKKKIYK